MRKAITMIVVLALGVSLWAESSPTRPSKNDVEIRFPDHRDSDSRTETYELYMVDSYGDGWNGASLDLYVNDVLIGDDLTIDDGDEASFEFDVEVGDDIHTTWTSGAWDGECAYAFYNAAGELVAESDFDLLCSFTVWPSAVDVFFSEHAEGSSYNKYLEIYNNTGADYDMHNLSLSSCSNGCDEEGEFDYPDNVTFAEGTIVAAGDVFVVAHPDADAAILAEADYTDFVYLTNGDDAFALTFAGAEADNYHILDIIGDMGDDPGSGWSVAGTENATANHTLQRNADVTSGNEGDWASSAGTSADDSEWTVFENNDWTGLGSHTVGVQCDANELTVYMNDSYGDGWNGNVLTIGDDTFELLTGSADTADACLEDGSYSVTCDGGSWQGEVSWSIVDASGTVLLEGGAPYSGALVLGETNDVLGCTDPVAENYDPDATIDDGSCYYEGDSCSIAYDFVSEGGALDGSVAVESATTGAGDADWYTFTLDMAYENLMVSLVGSEFDTQLDVYSDCETQLGYNDDYDGVQSQVDLTNVAAGTYHCKVYGYSSAFGNYVLTVDAYMNPTNPTALSALGGIERVYLSFEPAQPAAAQAASFGGTADEHIQWQYDNKKEPVNETLSARGVTRAMLVERIEDTGLTRDTDVIVTLFDSYGDGHYGGDSDGSAWVVSEAGDTLATLPGPWTGTSASFGPFTMADGLYSVEWDQTAPWLSEQTMEVTLASDTTVVLGSGAAPSACFGIGEGNICGGPDLTVTSISYDGWTGRGTVGVANIGTIATGYFYTMAFIQEPDTTATYPPGYFQYAWEGVGLAAGDSAEFYLSSYLTLPGFVGGYDDSTYTYYAMADGYGMYVAETNEGNNVSSITVVNSNPLANSTWNLWRSDGGGDYAVIENISAPDWQPASLVEYTDEPLTPDVEYCYMVTQIDGTTESAASDPACATPSAAPDVPEPTDLQGSSSGFDVFLSWTSPPPYEGTSILLGTPSNTRQGGDTVDDATEITELPASLEGTTSGYTDDYDEVCPYTGATAPDVVYSITPANDMAVNMTTCYSSYDTKMYVYENEVGNLAVTTDGADACSDDTYPPGVDDCTAWTSYIEGVAMTAGNTYYVVIDGYAASEGDYVLDIEAYNPLAGFTIWSVDGDNYSAIGQAGPQDTEWSTVLFAAEPTDISLAMTATYLIPGIFDPVISDVVGPVTVTVQLEDSPNNLVAMDYGDDVHLDWDPPIDASNMELAYDDGVVANAWWYGGAVAVRFRVNGTYAINGLANSVWTGGWPDAYLGEQPFTLSILALDEATDLPGDTLYQEAVLVDADPTSDTYGWAMTDSLADNAVTVTGDVFIMYSDFGYDFENSTAGPDMDMMGCDAVLDFPGNKYSYNVACPDAWCLDIDYAALACGDWILHMFADFTVGGGASFGNDGVWVDAMGQPSVSDLPPVFADMEAASTKENPVELMNPPVSDPVWAHESADRDMLAYNIYRDGVHVDEQDPNVTEYMDHDLDWGTYTYYVTAQYDGHESIATNEVEVTLSNVAPDAVMLISPGDGLEVSVDSTNLDEEVAFIWTAAVDNDNDPVEYFLAAYAAMDTGDTLWNVLPETPIVNESFDEATVQDNGWQYLPDGWEGYPNQNSQTVVFEGETMYNSEDTFVPFDGTAAVKLWGLYEGENTENNIFQTWYDGVLPAGTQFFVDAMVMSHNADWVGQGGNSFVLFAKYFTADWGWLGMDVSETFNGDMSADEWHYLWVNCTVPEGASTVQVGAMLVQPTGDDHGSVYMDDFYMHLPLVTTGLFVPYGALAQDAVENGVTDLTWTWDVWSHDGFEYTPSSSGPREIHVDVSEMLGIDGLSLPTEFALHNNYPNPFNPVTNIVYDIPEVTDVTLEIYNVMGQRVRTLAQGSHEPGRYQIVWNATNDFGQGLSSGMYIYRIQAGDFVSVKKLVLMK